MAAFREAAINENNRSQKKFEMSANPRALSPLRYPGGKRWLAPHVEKIVDVNALDIRLFVEPFAGGASVALHMLHNDHVDAIGLMDRDPLVASFWKVLFFDTEWLVKKVRRTDVTLSLWNRLKNSRNLRSDRQRAFACLYLNRTSFSGILNTTAGPIGGQRQASKYKIDCRFPKDDLADRIDWLGRNFRSRVLFVWNWSWRRGLVELRKHVARPEDTSKIFVYLDPPFYKKAENLYNHYFDHAEHESLRDFLADVDLPWFLSYDDCNEVRFLYQDMSRVSVNSLYNAARVGEAKAKRKPSSELVITNLAANYSEIKFPRRRVRGTEITVMEEERRVGNFPY